MIFPITLDELQNMTERAKDELWILANGEGRDPKIYLHWTAGHYGQFFEDYHINIDEDGQMYATTDDFADILPHTWRRNTGAIGIALAGCCTATTNDGLGDEGPTPAQIERMAQAIAVICKALEIPIDKQHVLTHGEAADNLDGYDGAYGDDECYGPQNGCERWDLQYLDTDESPYYTDDYNDPATGGNVLRGKAIWYSNK